MSTPNGPGTETDLVTHVVDRVLFALDESLLSSNAHATLDRQAAGLQRFPQVTVRIAGNCDDRGTEEFNIPLGQRRANAAKNYLEANGISSSRITTISYGKDRPTALADDKAFWTQNRNAITLAVSTE